MKAFSNPIHYDDFWQLVDPNATSDFHRPFDLGDGETCFANGRMILRVQQAVLPEDKVSFEESAKARERVLRFKWHDYAAKDDGEYRKPDPDWKELRSRGKILSSPEVPAWEPTMDSTKRGGFDFVDRPRLQVGARELVIPVSTLQLMRRLPNCEVFVGRGGESHVFEGYGFLPFRFTNGIGLASTVKMVSGLPYDGERGKYGIWIPRVDRGLERMGGGVG